mgnify:CR=1 FL=1
MVQVLPSSQLVPLVLGGSEQRPVPVSHVPASWHWSSGVQTTGFPPTQVPAPSQVSVCEQASPSSHGVTLLLGGSEQMPVPVSQVPASWHWSSGVQTTGLPPTQVPAPSHSSGEVQRLPSLHDAPFGLTGSEHTPAVHVPASWH